MKHKIYIIVLVSLIGLFGCNDFLDVTSSEKILQKDLFKDSNGFRMAVNGVYKDLSSPNLYGKNLSWGFVSAIGHNYEVSQTTLPSDLYQSAIFRWDVSDTQMIADAIWSRAYNIIANCNNIIQETESRDSLFFREKSLEKNLILGEMYGLRAMMHFDMLRLFAPAPVMNYSGSSIPYVEKYPDYHPIHQSTTDVLNNIITDMEKAKEILAPIDTIKFRSIMTYPENRYRTFYYTELKEGEFFNYRCQRMNFFAATALLARVYLYKGDFENAFANANLIYKYHKLNWFKWTDPNNQGQSNDVDMVHIKRPDESLFLLHNSKNFENIEAYTLVGTSGIHRFRMNKMDELFQNDLDDFRYLGWYNRDGLQRYLTWMRPTGTSEFAQKIAQYQGPLIPIIRFSEMYHVMIEYYIHKGNIPEAINLLNDLRLARGAKARVANDVTSDVLMDKLVIDIIRETLTEGQTFFMYKRLKRDIFNGATNIIMEPQDWTIPIPHSETAY
ncbi:MAG: RagB/SusD family nutrient uptake outer membrane protein [Bacteroidia bacterium]|nr:RagB/SusD family nutrient uptake outer membrane protein [Bacteroidia bacterium]